MAQGLTKTQWQARMMSDALARGQYKSTPNIAAFIKQHLVNQPATPQSNSKKAKRYDADVESSFIQHVSYAAGTLTVTIAGYGDYDYDASLDDYKALISADSVGQEFNLNIRE